MWIELTQHPKFFHCVLVLGLSLCALSIYLVRRTIKFIKVALPATGTVLEIREYGQPQGHEDEVTWHPVIKFQNMAGETFSFECYGSSNKREFKKGSSVEILYDPERPSRAVVNTWWRLWLFKLTPSVFGSGFIWAALRNL